jgi:hypothetical protein
MRIPEPHELIGFFGSVPTVEDEKSPWAYNRVTFSAELGNDKLVFEVQPDFGRIRLVWLQNSKKRVELILKDVESLDVDDREACLVVGFADSLDLGSLRLRLAPHVSLFWNARPN